MEKIAPWVDFLFCEGRSGLSSLSKRIKINSSTINRDHKFSDPSEPYEHGSIALAFAVVARWHGREHRTKYRCWVCRSLFATSRPSVLSVTSEISPAHCGPHRIQANLKESQRANLIKLFRLSGHEIYPKEIVFICDYSFMMGICKQSFNSPI